MEGDAGRCTDSPIWDFRTVARSAQGQSLGVPRFPNLGFLGSPKVHRWGGGKFCLKGIFYQSQGPSLGTPFLPSGHFWSSPKVRRWVMHSPDSGFCIRASLGSDAGCDILLIQGSVAGHPLRAS